VEFVFHSSASATNSNVTQAMSHDERPKSSRVDCQVRELVRAVRRVHELTSRCRVNAPLLPIVELEQGTTFGYESPAAQQPQDPVGAAGEALLLATPCSLIQRYRRLQQLVVTEAVLDVSHSAHIFLNIDPNDLERPDFLKGLRRPCRLLAEPGQLVLTLPVSLVGESVGFATMHARLRDLGLSLAYHDVMDGPSLVRRLSATPGDFLKLSPTLIEGVENDEDRQRHIRSIVQAASDLGCEVIADGIASEEEAVTCLNLGCRYGQGQYFQSVVPLEQVRSR
jgi:EAL domain-containing protein (putative c-di-GMP-specific phosphodiesterase class I)